MTRLPLRVAIGVGLVAGSVLALQVLLTRLFSAALFYHFSFLSISLALLGAGTGGILVYVRPGWFERRPLAQELARWSGALALLLIVVPAFLVRIHLGDGDDVTLRFSLLLALMSALTTLLFAVAGTVIALAIRGYTANVTRLYAFDLGGAALGALVIVPLMWAIPVPVLVVALAPLAACAALLFEPRRALAGVLALALAAVVVAAATDFYEPDPVTATAKGTEPVSDKWTPLSRVVAYEDPPVGLLFYDRVYAPVMGYHRGDPLPDWKKLGLGPQSIGYDLAPHDRTLVIGGGGGRDILNALSSGARRVDVIELNRAIRDAVDGPLRNISGAPYSLPRVHTEVGDGRSTIARSDARYDVIHMGFTDTLSANSAQAFALTENNLYTVEAFKEYLDHLGPNGVLDVTRPYRLVGDEALRLTVLTLAAFREAGFKDPERHVVVVLGRDLLPGLVGTVLARKRPWTDAELDRIRELARERGDGVAFAPGGPYRLEWAQLARASSPDAFCSSYALDVCAPTDNQPFFFQMRRLGDLGGHGATYIYAVDPFIVLLVTFGILVLLAALLMAAPLLLAAKADRPSATSLLYFAAIGLGFLTLEVVLIQRFVLFLGFPTYAISIVLFALLLWTGAGSLLAGRAADPARALQAALAAACVLIAASAWGLSPVLSALIDLPFALRTGVTVLLLAPAGLVLGMAMPLGLTRLLERYPTGVAWAWGVNGIMSVVGSVLAITVAILAGFPAATLVALACYLVALIHVSLDWRVGRVTRRAGLGRAGVSQPAGGGANR
jgi:hypothetical protein